VATLASHSIKHIQVPKVPVLPGVVHQDNLRKASMAHLHHKEVTAAPLLLNRFKLGQLKSQATNSCCKLASKKRAFRIFQFAKT
jgi:hypothetical protein